MRRIAFLLVFAGLAQAKPGDGDVITDKDLKPYLQELGKFDKDVRDRIRTVDELLVHFRGLAQREKHPRKAAIRRYIHGFILMGMKRPKDAGREFEAALDLFEEFPAVLGNLAILAHRAKDTKHAIRLLRRALDLNPSYTKALNLLGSIYAEQGKYERAIKLFTESFDLDANVSACRNLSMVHTRLYHDAYVEKRKRKQADAAVEWAETYKALAPNDGNVYVVLARVLEDVGRYPKAVEVLEQAQIATITEGAKIATLYQLYLMHAGRKRLKPAVGALKRMLKYEELVKGKGRAEIEQKIKDLEENGGRVFLIWYVKHKMKILKNPGHDAKSRADAVRQLLRFYTDRDVIKMKELEDLRLEVWRTAIQSLKDAPPEVSIAIFRFFQTFRKDPTALVVLVHFIYPNDDANRTPEVRREAVRTICLLGGTAALPTLYYCLRDEPGMVLREVERHLASLCQVRSKVGEGMEPLNRAQAKLARKEWRKHFTGDDGAEKLVEALTKLRDYVDMEPGFDNSTKPIADHITSTILLDNDMPFATWLAAYKFLRDYLKKEFRPVSERGKQVTERNRKAIVKAIADFFGGKSDRLPEVNNPSKPIKKQPKKPAETKKPK